MTHDVCIVGSGPAGIFAAYELNKLNPELDILIIEQGKDIYERKCPISEDKVSKCINCKPCDIMRGFGGAGAFSDGKYNFTTEFGGWLSEYLSDDKIMELIEYIDNVNISLLQKKYNDDFKIPQKYSTNPEIKAKALKYDLHLLDASVRHLGTDNNFEILIQMYKHLKNKIKFKFNTKVLKMYKHKRDNKFILDITTNNNGVKSLDCEYLIAAPGRAGAEWLSEQCTDMGLKLVSNQIDVGVRIELPAEIFKHITDDIYELKVKYRTKGYGDIVRTFCMNPYGYVVSENTDGIITVNGHSNSEKGKKSKNTNFALLVSNKFTEPFNQPHQYGKRIASFSNMLGGGVLVQRFGDLIKGRRTNEHRLKQSFTKPTLNATPGDLSLVLPKRQLDNIIEMIYALDNICPGTANDDTLLYGAEVKFYSSRLDLSNKLETNVEKMFAIGDGAGVSRSLSQASVSGVHVAREISNKI